MRPLLILAAGVLTAGTAWAGREVAAEEKARLARGEVLLEVAPVHDAVSRIWMAEDIGAPPETVWAELTDCAEALRYVPRLKSCEVLRADPAGRWDVRRHKLANVLFLPDVKATFRLDYDRPRTIRFRQIEGDMGGTAGEWRLEALPGAGGTRVVYEAEVVVPEAVPGPLARALIRLYAPSGLKGLRTRSLERAQAVQARLVTP